MSFVGVPLFSTLQRHFLLFLLLPFMASIPRCLSDVLAACLWINTCVGHLMAHPERVYCDNWSRPLHLLDDLHQVSGWLTLLLFTKNHETMPV
jgi:hypothetical protein